MPNIKATLKRKVGPLPVWGWLAVGGVGIGMGLYLRRRSSAAAPGGPVDELVPVEGESAFPVDVTGRAPEPIDGGYEGEPLPELPDLPDVPLPLPEETFEPIVVDCPEGYVMDMFGQCVPDPLLVVTPDPTQGGDRDRLRERRERLRRRIDALSGRIRSIREGGVTERERARLRTLRERRRTVTGRLRGLPRRRRPPARRR